VAGHERELRIGKLAVDDVQVGSADGARLDADAQLSRPRLGVGQACFPERFAGKMQYLCAHGI